MSSSPPCAESAVRLLSSTNTINGVLSSLNRIFIPAALTTCNTDELNFPTEGCKSQSRAALANTTKRWEIYLNKQRLVPSREGALIVIQGCVCILDPLLGSSLQDHMSSVS